MFNKMQANVALVKYEKRYSAVAGRKIVSGKLLYGRSFLFLRQNLQALRCISEQVFHQQQLHCSHS